MVKNIILIGIIIFINSCSREDDDLALVRMDYTGDELKTEGYYVVRVPNEQLKSCYFLYRNGIVLYGGSISLNSNLDDYVLSLSEKVNNDALKGDKSGWGVFILNGEEVDIETWEAGGPPIKTVVRSGEIIDDETFVINSFLNNYNGETSTRNDTFYFKEFSPKPDSTNMFIK